MKSRYELLTDDSDEEIVDHENPTSPGDSSDSDEGGDATVQNFDETGMVYRSFKSKKAVRSKIISMIGAAMSGHKFNHVIIYKDKKRFQRLIPPIDQSIISCVKSREKYEFSKKMFEFCENNPDDPDPYKSYVEGIDKKTLHVNTYKEDTTSDS